MMEQQQKKIGIIGGGPSALFMYKRLVELDPGWSIEIFERSEQLGAGMPYSKNGSNHEHVTNVSDNEIPSIMHSVEEWIQQASPDILKPYQITAESFNEYKVLPRLLFGQYLSHEFDALLRTAKGQGLLTKVHLGAEVIDIKDVPEREKVQIFISGGAVYELDYIIICTGHYWPVKNEGIVPNYFDSPYPPSKLALQVNYPVAIRGSSLTAIDAIRTLARHNGHFIETGEGIAYTLAKESVDFKIVMYSRNGLLPALRFHLEDSHLAKKGLLTENEMQEIVSKNEGFLPLDVVFEKNFIAFIRKSDPDLYEEIKAMTMEEFVDHMMTFRKSIDAFTLFKAEFTEAEKSIKRQMSIHWKEMLAVLSFTLNYPAKYFSAEDMIRLQKVLMPLISIVIAFVPQTSGKELIALYQAGILELVSVGEGSNVLPGEDSGAVIHYRDEDGNEHSAAYKLFVDSIGQPHLRYDQFPFKSLLNDKTVSPAFLKFRSTAQANAVMQQMPAEVQQSGAGVYHLQVSGIAINDYFQVLDQFGACNPRIYIMAVPFIAGYNPDYSGLDFCEAASLKIINRLHQQLEG